MARMIVPPPLAFSEEFVDHRHLPDTDGSISNNSTEHSQSSILTSSLWPLLEERLPGGRFFVGQDVGIYWRLTMPVLDGCKSPDWYLVPGVPGMINGTFRRSYVMWKEKVSPLLVVEYVSGDGKEERDRTPDRGKFWVYEQAVRAANYVIYDSQIPLIEAYHLDGDRYAPIEANAARRYPIAELGIEFGLRRARFRGVDLDWLRVWDSTTETMVLDVEERGEMYRKQADEAAQRADSIV